MRPESLAFLKSLLDTPGPSAFEAAPSRVWRREAEAFADEVRADVSGNSYATLNPGGRPRVMLAGHIDEIGVMVTHIDDEGYVSFDTIGGWDHQVFVGQRVRLLGREGPVDGVVGKKAIHLMEKDDREKVSKVEDLWIDVGAVSRDEAQRFADRVRADVAGNSFATLNPDGRPRAMFAGHIDEIGVMVSHIDEAGFVSFDTIGGWDPQVFVGQRVTLLGRNGAVPGFSA